MKIIVCIKQVPDTNDVRWTKENNLMREGLTNILNPCDEFAIQAALKLKEEKDAEVILLSMGPECAVEALEYGLALGADRAILLSDKRFSGADTKATSKTLAAAIKNVIKDFDYIFTGQFAIDGDTAQTGPALSATLKIPYMGFVQKIESADNDKIRVKAEREEEIATAEIKTPCLISLLQNCAELKDPKIEDYITSQQKEIEILNFEKIEISPEDAGIKGSPTYVKKAFRPEIKRNCRVVELDVVREILSFIKEENDKEN